MNKNNKYEYFIDVELDGSLQKLLPDFDEPTSPSLSNVSKKTHSLGGGMNCFGRCKSMC